MAQQFPFLRLPLERQVEVFKHHFRKGYNLEVYVKGDDYVGSDQPPVVLKSRIERERKIIREASSLLKPSANKALEDNFRGKLRVAMQVQEPYSTYSYNRIQRSFLPGMVPVNRLKVIELTLRDDASFVSYGGDKKSQIFKFGWRQFTVDFAHPGLKSLEIVRCFVEDDSLFTPIYTSLEDMGDFSVSKGFDDGLLSSLRTSILRYQPEQEKDSSHPTLCRYDGKPIALEMIVSCNDKCELRGCDAGLEDGHVDLEVTFAIETPDRIKIMEKFWQQRTCPQASCSDDWYDYVTRVMNEG